MRLHLLFVLSACVPAASEPVTEGDTDADADTDTDTDADTDADTDLPGCASDDAFEPNDTPGEASDGTAGVDLVVCAASSDFHRILVPPGAVVDFEVDGDVDGRLTDAGGGLNYGDYLVEGDRTFFRYLNTSSDPFELFGEVETDSVAPVSYTYAAVLCADDSREYDESSGTPPGGVNSMTGLSLTPLDNVDVFTFDVGYQRQITSTLTSASDLSIELRSANGTLLSEGAGGTASWVNNTSGAFTVYVHVGGDLGACSTYDLETMRGPLPPPPPPITESFEGVGLPAGWVLIPGSNPNTVTSASSVPDANAPDGNQVLSLTVAQPVNQYATPRVVSPDLDVLIAHTGYTLSAHGSIASTPFAQCKVELVTGATVLTDVGFTGYAGAAWASGSDSASSSDIPPSAIGQPFHVEVDCPLLDAVDNTVLIDGIEVEAYIDPL